VGDNLKDAAGSIALPEGVIDLFLHSRFGLAVNAVQNNLLAFTQGEDALEGCRDSA
jgi:hypothetical protein